MVVGNKHDCADPIDDWSYNGTGLSVAQPWVRQRYAFETTIHQKQQCIKRNISLRTTCHNNSFKTTIHLKQQFIENTLEMKATIH
jgi:hypothetical protein